MNLVISNKRTLFTSARCLQRIKTAKDRKDHFFKVNAWKVNEYEPVINELRKPKKKVALLLGYNGSGYQGMQANPGIKSIEQELFNALVKVEAISKSNSTDPKKVQLMRAARTDKGVHASCNLVSLKMICQDKQIIQQLNDQLPKNIRIWGYVETQRNFHAKTKCDSRIYEYLLPSYTLKRLELNKQLKLFPDSEKDYKILTENSTLTRYISPTDQTILSNFRVEKDRFEKFKLAMSLFQGTHNFHNYTITRSFKDPAANRFMIDISVSEPMIIEGMEWISIKLHGQSFMLHQIRKMISMAMLSVRTGTPLSLIPKTFEMDKINIPKAPALGLLLERPVFQLYNDRMKSIENRNCIDFDLYKDEIESFKKESIYKEIFEREKENHEFDIFLASIDSHIDTSYQYFNSEGVIPESCILKTKYSIE